MALQQVVCTAVVMIILMCTGCNSQLSECGRANLNTKIIGGQDASPGSWPWLTFFQIGSFLCGGSLINNQWVLTAAHCITKNDLSNTTVVLGLHTISVPSPNTVQPTVEDIIQHPQYNKETYDNDICLVKLSAPVNFTDYIRPVCLAAANSTFYTNLSSWVTGFGKTGPESLPDTLKEVNVPIVGNNECKCYNISPPVTDNMMCAGLKAGGKDACQGDSGGPLVTKNDSIWVQSGVVSFGVGCGLPQKPGVYARVSQYQEWIKNIVTGPTPGFVTFSQPGIDSDLSFDCTSLSTPSTTTTVSTPTPTPVSTLPPTPSTTTTVPTPTPTPSATTTVSNSTPTPFSTLPPTPSTTTTVFTPTPTPSTTTVSTLPPTFSTTTTVSTSPPNPSNSTTVSPTTDDSLFGGGEDLFHFAHFSTLCVVVLCAVWQHWNAI